MERLEDTKFRQRYIPLAMSTKVENPNLMARQPRNILIKTCEAFEISKVN